LFGQSVWVAAVLFSVLQTILLTMYVFDLVAVSFMHSYLVTIEIIMILSAFLLLIYLQIKLRGLQPDYT